MNVIPTITLKVDHSQSRSPPKLAAVPLDGLEDICILLLSAYVACVLHVLFSFALAV